MRNKNEKFVFSDTLEFEELGGGVKRKILAWGDDLMQVEVHFEKGAVGAMHSHPHTQLTFKNLLTVQANQKQAELRTGCLGFLLGMFRS